MNEFVLHSKRLNIKNEKQIKEILKLNSSKDLLALVVIFFPNTHTRQSKRINEIEPTR